MKHMICLAALVAVAGCSGGPPKLSEPAGAWAELNAPPVTRPVTSAPGVGGGVTIPPVRVSTLEGPPLIARARVDTAPSGQSKTAVVAVAKVESKAPGKAETTPGLSSEKSTRASPVSPIKVESKIDKKPKSTQATAPAAQPVWTLAKGNTLKSGLLEWAARATCHAPGTTTWQIRWETVVNYPIDAPLRFEGDFRKALGEVLALYQQAEKPLRAETISAQCLARVMER